MLELQYPRYCGSRTPRVGWRRVEQVEHGFSDEEIRREAVGVPAVIPQNLLSCCYPSFPVLHLSQPRFLVNLNAAPVPRRPGLG